MVHIQSIPVDLLIQIFAIGCRYPHYAYDCVSLSTPRHKKPFIVLMSLVCRYWHEIAMDEGNSCFWITNLSLGFSAAADTVVEAATFRRCLVDSKSSDI